MHKTHTSNKLTSDYNSVQGVYGVSFNGSKD